MALSSEAALWFLPFVLPICYFVCYTDMSRMRIPNLAVALLFLVFVVIGPFALPFDAYLWRYVHFAVVLVTGIALNAGGVMGAGDAKFIAAAAPMIHLGDLRYLAALFAATILAAFVAHRIGKHTPLRRLAPDWISWDSGSRFPMGLALAGTLCIYLGLRVAYGV